MLIDKINGEFDLSKRLARRAQAAKNQQRVAMLKQAVDKMAYYDEATELVHLLGYTTREVGGGFFTGPQVSVTPPSGRELTFKSTTEFVTWVRKDLCASGSSGA